MFLTRRTYILCFYFPDTVEKNAIKITRSLPFSLVAGSVEPDYNLQVASVVQEELVEEGDSDRQSNISGISQQDRDNKTILLRQAASGKLFKILEKYRDYSNGFSF